MTGGNYRKNVSAFSFFSGSALAMAFSLLSVIVLLLWWQNLLTRHLEVQYRYFATQLKPGAVVSEELLRLIHDQDEKLARALFAQANTAPHNAQKIILSRLQNRKNMVLYERTFFILLLFSGHLFFLYIYFRERKRRKLTEETILLATHELRQPLQSLSLALEMLAPKASGKSKMAITAGLNDINRLSEHVRYLATAFAPGKKTSEEIRISDLAVWFSNFAAAEFSRRERERLVINCPHVAVHLRIGEHALRFILRNLIGNALRYSTGMASIAVQIDRNMLHFTVANGGAKLTKEQFDRLGNLFFRSSSASVQNLSGFGLGLYLCGRIARRARGKLVLENDAQNFRARLLLRMR